MTRKKWEKNNNEKKRALKGYCQLLNSVTCVAQLLRTIIAALVP